MKTSKNNTAIDMHSFIEKMQTEDKRNIKVMRNFKWLMFIFAPLYILLFNIGPFDKINLYMRLGGLSFGLAFIIFALIFTKGVKEFRSVDYGVPTTKMLSDAIDRYKLQISKLFFVLLPLTLINIGESLILLGQDIDSIFGGSLLNFQLFYWILVIVGLIIGIIFWRIKHKPLKEAAEQLLNEMQGE